MEEAKNSPNPSSDKESQTFKQHDTGPSITERQIQQNKPANQAAESEQSEHNPDDPLEKVMQLWNFIKAPEHSGAVIAILTLVIAASNIGYDIVAACQLHSMNGQLTEMQQQTALTRQQLVGTQAAVIIFNETRWDSTKRLLTFDLSNTGLVTGTITSFTANVQKKTFPSQQPIGEGVPIEFTNREIGKNSNYTLDKGLPWPLPEIEDQKLWPGNEIATIEGQYTYTNGFGEIFSHKFCVLWLPHWHVVGPNGAGWDGGGWSGRSESCPLLERENEFFGLKKHAEEVTPH